MQSLETSIKDVKGVVIFPCQKKNNGTISFCSARVEVFTSTLRREQERRFLLVLCYLHNHYSVQSANRSVAKGRIVRIGSAWTRLNPVL